MIYKKILKITLLLLFSLSTQLVSADTNDQMKTGSITIQNKYNNQGIAGGNLLVYQVAQAKDVDGNQVFTLTTPFQGIGIKDDDLTQVNLDSNQAKYVNLLTKAVHKTQPLQTFDNLPAEGIVANNLPQGIYLFIQTKTAQGYELMSPFILSIPKDGKYDITAFEKMSPLKAKPKKEETITPTVAHQTKGKLPFTGQVWWPIPILIMSGLLCLIIALKWRRRRD
ncbi:hypothetical protein HK335_01565 [Streptococcus agalactiae]|nr:hypothetical protein SaSA53_1187 [Streptococcus agalactiae]EJZ03014.1 hypothetical protein M3M_06274 [Streptococcus agalactiae STIR-CD-17]EPU03376.1 hypothetical protein SAG0123_02970 [Streptococcus agalactiae STIR-CD-13]EPU05623.1 hypothetical protein SAG0122_07845 [Streptococcus agalactiae STIR-CD-09]EPW85990.1 hypothetical protein SAG0121_07075 [Streptococcus agalactiae STIR-CD-07]CCQ76128.1 hypothetical protein GBS1219_1142 [Streptococcus agalactiae SS1219]CCQ78901.1 hypothetical prote